MDAERLAGWLERGLGRAVIFLRRRDATPYRDTILYACTHNQVYDRQCEPGRAPYLLDVIAATSEPDFYRDRILAALAAPSEGKTPDRCWISLFCCPPGRRRRARSGLCRVCRECCRRQLREGELRWR